MSRTTTQETAALIEALELHALDDCDGSYLPEHIGNQAATALTQLQARVAELEAENATLAAGSCDVPGGKIGDEHGHFYCALQAENTRLREALENPPKHNFWSAGEPDCPRDLKAGNGEIWKLRCKVCGQDNPRDQLCRAALNGDTSHDQ